MISTFDSVVSQPFNNDCDNFVYLCKDTIVTFSLTGKGKVNDVPPSGSFGNPGTRYNPYPGTGISLHRGCLLAGETISNWFAIPILTDGTLEWTIGADSTQYGYYDWIMWKIAPSSCNEITNDKVAPVRCNWNGAPWGGTGLVNTVPEDGHSSNYEMPLDVKSGDYYVICINNWDTVDASVSIKFGGTALLGFYNPPVVNVSCDSVICQKENSTLSVNGGGISTNYVWSTGETSRSITVNPLETTTYFVTATTQECSKIESVDSITITVNSIPVPDFKLTPDQTVYTITTNIKFSDNSVTEGYITSWAWSFGDGDYSTAKNPVHAYIDTGTYTTQLIISNNYSCKDTIQKEIRVEPDFWMEIPTAFSPDNNGLNDYFEIFGYGITKFEMRIFNRWGEEIFVSNDIYNLWNGNKNNTGAKALQGVYVYTIIYETYDGIEKHRNGYVSLFR